MMYLFDTLILVEHKKIKWDIAGISSSATLEKTAQQLTTLNSLQFQPRAFHCVLCVNPADPPEAINCNPKYFVIHFEIMQMLPPLLIILPIVMLVYLSCYLITFLSRTETQSLLSLLIMDRLWYLAS